MHAAEPALVRTWLIAAAAMSIAFAGWALVLGTPGFPLDDAYITLHNAQAAIIGLDRNYGVAPLVGATSSVHLALIIALGLVFDLPWADAIAAWLAAAAYLAGLLFLARRCRLTPLETGLVAALGFAAGFAATHLLNGLETGLAMALVTWCIALALRGPSTWLAVLLGTMPFVRPELGILSAILLIHQLHGRWVVCDRRGAMRDLAVFAAAATPWLAWMWVDTGALVPQTADAKRAYFAEATLPWTIRAEAVAHAVGRLFLQIGPLALALAGLRSERVGRLALLFCALMGALFLQQFPGGLSHNWNRYLYILLPLFLAGLGFLLRDAGPRERPWLRGLAAAALVYAVAISPYTFGVYLDRVRFARVELAGLTTWMTQHIPAGARVAVHDAGYVAFATDYALIDVVGLKTPASRAVHHALTAPSGGRRRGEALARILDEGGAEYLVVFGEWDRDFHLTQAIRAAGGVLEPVRTQGAYQVYRVATRNHAAVAR